MTRGKSDLRFIGVFFFYENISIVITASFLTFFCNLDGEWISIDPRLKQSVYISSRVSENSY